MKKEEELQKNLTLTMEKLKELTKMEEINKKNIENNYQNNVNEPFEENKNEKNFNFNDEKFIEINNFESNSENV